LNTCGFDVEVLGAWSWDCNRTRTTSRGVTVEVSIESDYKRGSILSNEVRTLPVTADIIFCPSDTSPTPLVSASSAR
jgi:hypothetical protein